MAALIRYGSDLTKFSESMGEICSYEDLIAYRSSSLVCGIFSRINFFNFVHNFSIGLRSGLLAGQFIVLISFCSK